MRCYPVLERERTIGTFDTPEKRVSPGSVEKLLLRLDDGNAVESIIIATFGPRVGMALKLDDRFKKKVGASAADNLPFFQKKIRYETCVSTQVGCALDCKFCASSLVPFVRNLSVEELEREIGTVEKNIPRGGRLSKVVFAGVGEPLMNYDNVAEVVRSLSARGVHSRVNTVGVIPYLEKMFAERLPCELTVSIHAPEDDLRTEIMPVGKGYPLKEILRVLKTAAPGTFIEGKYLMLKGLNDSIAHARALAELLRGVNLVVGLQMYNRIDERDYEPSEPEQVRRFAAELRERGLQVGILNSNIGEPVQGGCGQLRARVVPGQGKSRLPVVD